MSQTANSDFKRRRPWGWLVPRFNLRTMLIVTTLLCLVLGSGIIRAERQRMACARLTQGRWHWSFHAHDNTYNRYRPNNDLQDEPWWLKTFPLQWRETHGIHYWRTVKTVHAGNTDPGRMYEAVAQLPALGTLIVEHDSYPDDREFWPMVGRLRTLSQLVLRGRTIDNEGSTHLDRLTNLKHLDLGKTIVGDEGIKHLVNLKSLEELWLDDTDITDDAVEHLGAMPWLKRVDLSNTRITAEAVAKLAQFFPSTEWTTGSSTDTYELEKKHYVITPHPWTNYARSELLSNRPLDGQLLNLTIDGEIPLTPERLENLSNVRRVDELILRGREIGDEQLAFLSKCREVTNAHFERTSIDHEGFRWLGRQIKLRTLTVLGSRVTPVDVAELARLDDLSKLTIGETLLDPEALRAILALPHLYDLELINCPLPPEALREFAQCGQPFDRLSLSGTGLSPELFLKHWPPETARLFWDGVKVEKDMVQWFDQLTDRAENKSKDDHGVSLPLSRERRVVGHWGELAEEDFATLTLRSRFIKEPYILQALSQLPDCRYVDLNGSEAGAATMDLLSVNPHLTTLIVSKTKVADGDLRHAVNWTRLQELDVTGCSIGDTGFAHLQSCWRLERLNADGTQIGDQSAKVIATMKRLRSLSLRQTNLTDEGLHRLHGLENLATLRLSGTQVTPAAVAEFERRLPQCTVEFVGPELYEAPRFRRAD
jgi:hypothetical protein